MLGYPDDDQGAAFRVGLRRVDSTFLISFIDERWGTLSYSCSSSLLNMPCSTSIQMKSGFVDAMSLVTNVLGIPWATPNSVFAGSACASFKAFLRFPGYVSMAARYGA